MTFDPGIVVAVVTALAALLAALSGRRQVDSESEAATREAMLALITPLTQRVGALEAEVATLQRRVAQFRAGVRLLCGQIAELGGIPVWQPEDLDDGEDGGTSG